MEQVVSNPKAASSLSRAFSRCGWIGFWSQVVVGAIPVVLMVYLFVFARAKFAPRAGFALVEWLTILGLFALAFTTFWSWRYTRVAKKIGKADSSITYSKLRSLAWTGIFASTFGIFFSIIVMLIETAHLSFYFITAPQGGVQVVQTTSQDSASWVSAIDMLSLMALVTSLLAELIVLFFSQWLLLKTTAWASKAGALEMTMADEPAAEMTPAV